MPRKTCGVALVVTLVLIILLSMLGVGILLLVSGHYRTSKHQIDRTKAYYLAEAGMWHAIWGLRTDYYASQMPPPLGGIPDSITEDGLTANITIFTDTSELSDYRIESQVSY